MRLRVPGSAQQAQARVSVGAVTRKAAIAMSEWQQRLENFIPLLITRDSRGSDQIPQNAAGAINSKRPARSAAVGAIQVAIRDRREHRATLKKIVREEGPH